MVFDDGGGGVTIAQVMVATLAVPGVRTMAGLDSLTVWPGGEGPAVVVEMRQVVGVEQIRSPQGAPAARIALDTGSDVPLPLVVVEGDVAFVPDMEGGRRRVGAVLGSPLVDVVDLPPMLGWSEVLRCLVAVEGPLSDLDRAQAKMLVAAAGVEGARRVGVDTSAAGARLDAAIARAAAW